MSELASARPANSPRRRFRGVRRVVLIAVVVLVALALVAWRPVLTGLGRFLIVDESPVPSDVVVVSGGNVDRILYGIELVQGGTAPRLLVLVSPADCSAFWGFRCDQAIVQRLLEMGLRREQVIIEERSHSTHTDAVYSRQDMEREGLASAVVISEPFHMRRISWAWRRAFADAGVRLTFTAIPFERTGIRLEGWWTREDELLFVFEEYVKLGLYWVKGYL
ncbi:YdcF family protein [Nitrospinae bacterium AH_259_B05_G02_I21]|nr:YdcF family protein [Nitrospinae bacterium AH_259_B05_G02_I21]